MNYVVYFHNPNDNTPTSYMRDTIEYSRELARALALAMPGVEVFLAQKISSFISEVTIKET